MTFQLITFLSRVTKYKIKHFLTSVSAGELARQNRITQEILEHYLQRRLFPHRSGGSRPPSLADILPPPERPNNLSSAEEVVDDAQDAGDTADTGDENLQSVESEQVNSVYEEGKSIPSLNASTVHR